jgi:hypothetical protein
MILWEIEHEEVPFDGKDEQELKQLVFEESLRPLISSTTNTNLREIIRSCWHKKPERRPTIE